MVHPSPINGAALNSSSSLIWVCVLMYDELIGTLGWTELEIVANPWKRSPNVLILSANRTNFNANKNPKISQVQSRVAKKVVCEKSLTFVRGKMMDLCDYHVRRMLTIGGCSRDHYSLDFFPPPRSKRGRVDNNMFDVATFILPKVEGSGRVLAASRLLSILL